MRITPSDSTFRGPRWMSLLLGAALGTGAAHAGVNFQTTFLKMCGFAGADTVQAAGYPWGGRNGTNGGLWDGVAGHVNDPYARLVSHGVNGIRLTGDYAGGNGAQAGIAKANNLLIESTVAVSAANVGQTDWNNATSNGTNFNNTTQSVSQPLMNDVYNYVYNQLVLFNTGAGGQTARIDMFAPGVEINTNGFCGCPGQSPLYYQLLYEACVACRQFDIDHPGSDGLATGIIMHFNDIGAAGSSIYNHCSDMLASSSVKFHDRTLSGTTVTVIPFDCFGFSYHEYGNPLDNPNWTPTNGQVIGLKQAFFKENLGHFGKFLLVQETAYPWRLTRESFPGTPILPSGGYYLKYTSCSSFKDCCCGPSPYGTPTYCCDATGYHDMLMAEMTEVSGSVSKLGCGVIAWAACNLIGWGTGDAATQADTPLNPQEYNFALWDSDQTASTGNPLGLVSESNGTTVLSAFNHTYTLNR